MRRLLPATLALAGATSLAAQASPYLPRDHPLLPLAEYLIARGDIADPSPMVRPFRRADLIRALDQARLDPRSPSGRAAERLRAAFTDRSDDDWFRLAPRAGVQAFTHARRDLLHPAGDGGVRPYAELTAEARIGKLVLVTRPIADNRLKLDPDWPGARIQQAKQQAYRFADAYLGAQFGKVRLFYGQMDRNWGPPGNLGIGLADYGYPRSDVGLEIRLRDVQIDVVGTELTPMAGADSQENKRYFMAHRVSARIAGSLRLALWETAVLAGPGRSFDPTFRNPLVAFAFPLQLGLTDDRNVLLGGDLEWRAGTVRLQAQAAIDDRWRSRPDPGNTGEVAHPGRWAFTLAGAGPLGRGALWQASLAAVNSLAFRTSDSAQSLIDRGVGIGPNFTDNLALAGSVTVPVAGAWTLTPDVAILWQGEGRIDAPFPAGQELTDTPELFIGTVATTYRLGAGLSGVSHGVAIRGSAGLHHTMNADFVAGRSRTRIEARLWATIGLDVGGVLR